MSLRTLLQHLFELEAPEDLRPRVEILEKRLRELDVEWTDVYDKFRNLHMRVARRVKVLEEDSSHEEPQGAGGEESAAGPMFSTLSPRAREAQRQILARRARGGQNGGE
jgi:hypothetical protein